MNSQISASEITEQLNASALLARPDDLRVGGMRKMSRKQRTVAIHTFLLSFCFPSAATEYFVAMDG
jgi:hypothetical protein